MQQKDNLLTSIHSMKLDRHHSNLATMCFIENPAPVKFKCGHKMNIPETSRIVRCPTANARNPPTECPPPHGRTSKGSSHSRKFDCPACRKKSGDGKKDDDGIGAGGSASASPQTQSRRVTVGA